MKTGKKFRALLLIAACATMPACDLLLGRNPMFLQEQADDIAGDIIEQSLGLLAQEFTAGSRTLDYSGEEYDGDTEAGTATFASGTYVYDYYYYNTAPGGYTYTVYKNYDWDYDNISIEYKDFQRFSYHITIISGSLKVDGTLRRETTYRSDTNYTSGSQGGSLTLSGTVKVEGRSGGEDVLDTLSVNISKTISGINTGYTTTYSGTIKNSHETWTIYY